MLRLKWWWDWVAVPIVLIILVLVLRGLWRGIVAPWPTRWQLLMAKMEGLDKRSDSSGFSFRRIKEFDQISWTVSDIDRDFSRNLEDAVVREVREDSRRRVSVQGFEKINFFSWDHKELSAITLEAKLFDEESRESLGSQPVRLGDEQHWPESGNAMVKRLDRVVSKLDLPESDMWGDSWGHDLLFLLPGTLLICAYLAFTRRQYTRQFVPKREDYGPGVIWGH